MRCPFCGSEMSEFLESYRCCVCRFAVPKEVAGRRLDGDLLRDLVESGRTPVVEGFVSRFGRRFSAALVLRGRRVRFEFPDGGPHAHRGGVYVRVESTRSGTVRVAVRGAAARTFVAHFGLIPARLAECYGVIAGAKLALHCGGAGMSLVVSANSREFVRYALRERIPARKDVRAAVEHMWAALEGFAKWEVRHEPSKTPALKGGPLADGFPRGAFPWLRAEVMAERDCIRVRLPDCPAVRAQFLASIRTAEIDGGEFRAPLSAEGAVRAWVKTVGAGGGSRRSEDAAGAARARPEAER